MHSHPNYIVYVLNSFRARITFPDGTQVVSESEAGKAYWKRRRVTRLRISGRIRFTT
jgi:hypothetical protein